MQVAFDRLLARLMEVARERWMLKGALALDYRLGDRARTSKDMDLAHAAGEAEAAVDLGAAVELDLGDFFRFTVERTSHLDETQGDAAVRHHIVGRLGRSVFNEAAVDVGFTDRIAVEPELIQGPRLLEFAEISPITVPALPMPYHVAQKVHAYSRGYGSAAQASSRPKDLADLVLMAETFVFHADRLRHAVEQTFESRATHPIPPALPSPPDRWRHEYPRVAARFALDPDLEAAYGIAARFLDPVLASQVQAGTWDPALKAWTSHSVRTP